jgi:hypothetical protein
MPTLITSKKDKGGAADEIPNSATTDEGTQMEEQKGLKDAISSTHTATDLGHQVSNSPTSATMDVGIDNEGTGKETVSAELTGVDLPLLINSDFLTPPMDPTDSAAYYQISKMSEFKIKQTGNQNT